MNETQFRQQLAEQGYGAGVPLEYKPHTAREMHTHDTTNFLLVLSGELTLVTENRSVTYHPGDTCTLAAGTLHSEQTGASGAAGLVGKK